jgi:DNA-binding MarR family transcriptional regulator
VELFESRAGGDPTLGELVTTVATRLRAAWREGLAPWGLSPHQGRALLVVAIRPGLRPTDLATRLDIAPRSATEVVDGLVDAGLLVRTPSPHDRRALTLDLTLEGRERVRALKASRAEAADTFFDVLSAQDRKQLSRHLSALVAASEDLAPAHHLRRH